MIIRTSLAGITALTIAACSSSDGGRSAAKVSEIEWTVTSSGQTVQGRADIGYEGSHVKDVTFKLAGAAAGRMDFDYTGGRVDAIDLTDADGDRASYVWEYDDGRLASMRWAIQQVVAYEQELEYDDANGGRLRRVTSTSYPGASPTTMVETYDYDDAGRLEEISAIEGTSTWSSEIRYDESSRMERFTRYTGGDFTNADLSYDDLGRLELVELGAGDRYEITYGANDLIEEILILAPSAGQTTRITYRYVSGEVDGMTFNPELPLAGLVDLAGTPFDVPDLTAVALPLALDDVPSQTTNNGTCSHDVCESGSALSTSCDSCAATVCAQDGFCCSSSWDASCVSLAESYCGVDCGGDTGGTCSHDVCVSGTALSASCDSCAAAVCASDSYCCSSSWDASCVSEVATYCGFSC